MGHMNSFVSTYGAIATFHLYTYIFIHILRSVSSSTFFCRRRRRL